MTMGGGNNRDYRASVIPGGSDYRPAAQRAEQDVGALVAGNFAVRQVATSQTILLNDVCLVVVGSSTITITLPPVNGNTEKWYSVKNAQAQDVTILCLGTDQIEGATTFTLHADDAVIIENDGQMWRVMSQIGVTSVALTMPVEFAVSGSPVTGDGTFAVTKATETANTVWAGPTTGAAAQPTFRALVAADIPSGASGQPTDILVISPGAASIPWVVPVAVTEFNGSKIYETTFDLTHFTQARIMVAMAAAPANTPILYGQYSTNSGSTWAYLDGGSGPQVTPNAGGVNASGWVTLASGAKADVWLRIVGSDAGGPIASSFGTIYLQAK